MKLGEDFAKFCGLLRIYELYYYRTKNFDVWAGFGLVGSFAILLKCPIFEGKFFMFSWTEQTYTYKISMPVNFSICIRVFINVKVGRL